MNHFSFKRIVPQNFSVYIVIELISGIKTYWLIVAHFSDAEIVADSLKVETAISRSVVPYSSDQPCTRLQTTEKLLSVNDNETKSGQVEESSRRSVTLADDLALESKLSSCFRSKQLFLINGGLFAKQYS